MRSSPLPSGGALLRALPAGRPRRGKQRPCVHDVPELELDLADAAAGVRALDDVVDLGADVVELTDGHLWHVLRLGNGGGVLAGSLAENQSVEQGVGAEAV